MQPLIILILLSFSLSQAWLHTKGGSVDLDMLDEVMDVCGQHYGDFGLCLSLADIRNCEGTVFENHRKSLIQNCKLRLHFEWTKVHQKCQKQSILASF